ncbi:F0F1 ATP synthase subunit gamma [Alcaligenaceae bacterium CGII-47]|nr:F0F1 ATP synthase subunit gamma [Alcaligenaceae bacterium CGII-47]
MSQTLESLTRRTGTTQTIRNIVHTMKTLSAINAYPYEQAARAINDWHDTVLDGLQAFIKMYGIPDQTVGINVLRLIVVFGSDQGLCGSYNEAVAMELVQAPWIGEDHLIFCVGAQMEDAIRGVGLDVEATLMTPASVEGVSRLVGELIARIDAVHTDKKRDITVTLAFTERAEHGRQAVVVRQVIPLAAERLERLSQRPWTSHSLPHFDMTRVAVFAALLRNDLFASLFGASAEALVTENAARLARMQQAERSIDERLTELALATHTTRQSAITEELLDVIAGFEALKPQHVDRDVS